MNAYDLATYIENCITVEPLIFKAIAKALREQADKAADLQTTVSFLEAECKALRGQLNEQ